MLVAVAIGMSGCIVVPYPHHHVLEGSELTTQSLEYLRLNETTRSEVLERLGPPDIDFADQNVIVYAWSGTASKFFFGAYHSPGTTGVLTRVRRALLVRFDAGGRVAAFSIVERSATPVPYDPLVQPPYAHSDDWRVILGQWLKGREPAK